MYQSLDPNCYPISLVGWLQKTVHFVLFLGKVFNLAIVTTLVSCLLRSSYERDWVAIRVQGHFFR